MISSWGATWADVKQLGWVVLILWAFIGVLAVLTHDYFGSQTAAVALGLVALVTIVFGAIVAANLLVVLAADLVRWARRSRDDDHDRA